MKTETIAYQIFTVENTGHLIYVDEVAKLQQVAKRMQKHAHAGTVICMPYAVTSNGKNKTTGTDHSQALIMKGTDVQMVDATQWDLVDYQKIA